MTSDSLPGCWPVRRLADLLSRPLAYGVLKPGEPIESGVPLVRIQDMHSGRLDAVKMYRISPTLHDEFRRTALCGGELLLSIVGTLGKVVEVPAALRGANISRALCVLGPSEDIDRRFLRHVLTSDRVQNWVKQEGRGNAQAVLNLGLLRDLAVQVPPLLEQRKIAAILSSVDDAIEATQAVIDQLQVVKKAMMAELLTRGLPGRHTRFKQTEIGEVPEGWEVSPLDSCIEVGRPICYGILMPGTGHPGGVPVVKVKNIKNGIIEAHDLLLTSPELDQKYARSRLREGDVLLTIRGTTGRLARVPAALAGANITQDTARLSIRRDLNLDYLFYVLQSEVSQGQIRDQTRGQAVKGINIGDVRQLLLPLPGDDEQGKIVEAFATLDEVLGLDQRELAALQVVKSALMSVLLTGEVRVTPDEAAA